MENEKIKKERRIFKGAITIDVVDACNMNCRYCYIPKEKRAMPNSGITKEMEDKAVNHVHNIVKAMFDDNIIASSATVLASEPTLLSAKALSVIINLLHTRFNDVLMFTNGQRIADEPQYLDDMLAQVKDINRLSFATSIDGPKIVHDHNRGWGSWEKANKTMQIIIAKGFDIRSNCVVTTKSVEYSDEMKTFARECVHPNVTLEFGAEEPNIAHTIKDKKKIALLARDLDDILKENNKFCEDCDCELDNGYGMTEEARKYTCDVIHFPLKGDISMCPNLNTMCKSVGSRPANMTIIDALNKKMDMYNNLNKECLTCDKRDICSLRCTTHRTPNGYAHNCYYARK